MMKVTGAEPISGVAIDQGAEGAQAVDADGKPVQRKFKVMLEGNEAEVLFAAREAKLRGDDVAAQRLEALVGRKAEVSIFARYPVATGVVIGISAAGAGVGTYLIIRKVRANRALKQLQAPTRMRAVR